MFILGVQFKDNSGIEKFLANECNPETVGKVLLSDNTELVADVVILGVGSTLNTDWLKNSGLKLESNGSINVDEVNYTFIRYLCK